MKKQNVRHSKKVRNLVIVCTLCAIVLTVSTYAWFIGMKTVNVSKFNVNIATTEGLFLSMNGTDWSYKLDATDTTKAYTGNTNTWATNGLIPVSSVGDMDATVSRMKLYEKGSLTTTKGGYRLLTSRVNNYTDNSGTISQGEGYVAFDLFIKNLSGTEYYPTNEPLNEEAIYLTTNSSVVVNSTNGKANTGIENSVRVAFTQIGRVKGDTTSGADITAITCADKASGEGQVQVTGICRNAQIWEPNDKAHVNNAINWYETACKVRNTDGTDVTLASSYTTSGEGSACGTVVGGTANKTYAISRTIGITDNVDVYDGSQYNTYAASTDTYENYIAAYKAAVAAENATPETIATAMNKYKLVDFPYFTDTMKNLTGMQRPQFMTLAPNSITKLRVYVYIEGQDVDNYDFASLGKQITINFGFTKERFTETDVSYDSANSPSTDITPTEGA